MDYSSLMTDPAARLAVAIRAGDAAGATAIMALLVLEVAAAMARANADAGRIALDGANEVMAQFRTALAAERLSTARHSKATGAFDLALLTHHQIGLGLSII